MDRRDDSVSHGDVMQACTAAILVLGMHRSGTSSLAGTLVQLGGNAPRHLMPPQPNNERGFWESEVIVALNDEVLAAGQSRWDDWRRFDPAWYGGVAATELRARVTAALIDEYGNASLPVIKDPRICRLMPFWSSVLQDCGWPVRVLMPVRSPLEVALSLKIRDGLELTRGCLLWLRHVLDAEAETRGMPRAVFDWSDFLADWRKVLGRAGEQLQLAFPHSVETGAVDDFLSRSLRHHEASREELKLHPAINEWARESFAAMAQLAADPDSSNARNTLDAVRAEFENAAEAFGVILHDQDERTRHVSAHANSLAESNHGLIAERDDLLSRLTMEREAAKEQQAAERAAFTAEIAEQQKSFAERLANLEHEREHLQQLLAALEVRMAESGVDLNRLVVEKDRAAEEALALVNRMSERYAAESSRRARTAISRLWKSRVAQSRLAVPEHYDAIRNSIFFDPEFYLSANADVRTSGTDPALHYLLHGGAQCRDPGPLFSTRGYLTRNPDVAEAGMNALLHYELYGRREKRRLFD